jgi:hypothetical protein
MRIRKKATEMELALTRSEKNEAILQTKLRDEQLEKAKFERYDILLDSNFKRIQLSEKDEELKELKDEQQKLNEQIDDYSRKWNSYENRKSQAVVFKTNEPFNSGILLELYELIKKRIKDIPIQEEYLEKLTTIDDAFFQRLKKRAEGKNLSVLDIKRCIAFSIGMKVSDMVECFSVESRSIHQSSCRLKRKLKIDNDLNFKLFLKKLLIYE